MSTTGDKILDTALSKVSELSCTSLEQAKDSYKWDIMLELKSVLNSAKMFTKKKLVKNLNLN